MTDEDHVSVQPPAASFMDKIRDQHKKLVDSKTLDLDLPGYDGLLVARYRVLTVKGDINPIQSKMQREFDNDNERALYAIIDSMSRACIELLTRQDDTLKPLSQAFGPEEPPVRYDKKLVEFMGWPDEPGDDGGAWTARTVILRLFGGVETMIIDHGRQINNWMTNTTKGANEDFLRSL